MSRLVWISFATLLDVASVAAWSDRIATLLPETEDIWEKSDATLSCNYDVKQFSVISWYLVTHFRTLEASMEFKDNTCTVLATWLNSRNFYSYSCAERSFNVTLKSVSRVQHGNRWSYMPFETKLQSNVVTLLVKVTDSDVYYNFLFGYMPLYNIPLPVSQRARLSSANFLTALPDVFSK